MPNYSIPKTYIEIAKALLAASAFILSLQLGIIPQHPENALWISLASYLIGGLILSSCFSENNNEHLAHAALILLTLAWSLHFYFRDSLIAIGLTQNALPNFLFYNILSGLALVIGAGTRQFIIFMMGFIRTIRRYW